MLQTGPPLKENSINGVIRRTQGASGLGRLMFSKCFFPGRSYKVMMFYGEETEWGGLSADLVFLGERVSLGWLLHFDSLFMLVTNKKWQEAHAAQARCMGITLRMRTAISSGKW